MKISKFYSCSANVMLLSVWIDKLLFWEPLDYQNLGTKTLQRKLIRVKFIIITMEADCETSTLLKEINEDFSPHTENSHLNYFMSWLL